MSVLDTIKNTLETLAESQEVPMAAVYYGACSVHNLDLWNYFVFNRKKSKKASNRLDLETEYEVHVVHEDYIPEGYIETVINALQSQTDEKLRATADDILYNYTFKSKTDMVVEIATITFVRPEKRC